MSEPLPASDLLTAIKQTLFAALLEHGVDRAAARNATVKHTQQLLRAWGGDSHWLPHADRSARDAQIHEALSAGTPPTEIARSLTVSIRTVRRVKSRSAGLGNDEWCL